MISYRQATTFDLMVFASLDKELFPYSMWSLGQYKQEFESETRYFVVAVDSEQKIVGYAAVFAPGSGVEADILTIGTVPEYRRQGIAKHLMELMTSWAIERDTNAIMLEVKIDNLEAIGLYEALGYIKLNIRSNFYGQGLDAQVMRLELK